MSGGHWEYMQYQIDRIAEDVNRLIENNDSDALNDWGDPIGRKYHKNVIDKFREAERVLRLAYVYAQRIDWLVSGDDGEEQFLQRLERELAALATPSEEK